MERVNIGGGKATKQNRVKDAYSSVKEIHNNLVVDSFTAIAIFGFESVVKPVLNMITYGMTHVCISAGLPDDDPVIKAAELRLLGM